MYTHTHTHTHTESILYLYDALKDLSQNHRYWQTFWDSSKRTDTQKCSWCKQALTDRTSDARITPCKSCLVVNWSIPSITFTFSVIGTRRAIHTRHVGFSETSIRQNISITTPMPVSFKDPTPLHKVSSLTLPGPHCYARFHVWPYQDHIATQGFKPDLTRTTLLHKVSSLTLPGPYCHTRFQAWPYQDHIATQGFKPDLTRTILPHKVSSLTLPGPHCYTKFQV